MTYAIIVENDESKWDDKTGERYHFPNKYSSILKPGTKVIYYKGRLKDKKYASKRMSVQPHYFGTATVGERFQDNKSLKKDLYCHIINYIQFEEFVPFKINGKPFELVPANKKNNYWRDGVRKINKEIFASIISFNNAASIPYRNLEKNDLNQGLEESLESYQSSEGGKKFYFTSRYERDKKLRTAAKQIHGYSCHVCNFNFKEFYGEIGEGYIHIHHLKPISQNNEKVRVIPKNDLVPLCANCHSMIHRYRNKTFTIDELKSFIKKNKAK